MHPKCDELVAGPAHITNGLAHCGSDELFIFEHIAAASELIGRPRERSDARELPDVTDVYANVDEPAPIAT